MTYFDFEKHLARQAEFSKKTFGPGDRLISVVDHIQKELIEVLTAKNIAERQNEWIDVVILALDGALRSRMTPQQIIDGIVSKQTKNEARKWPDWRTAEPHKAIEHEKEGKAMTDYNELVKVLNSHRLYIAADAIEEQAEAIKAQAKEIGFLKEEISIWQSVFPDIAPEQVTRDKSVVEAFPRCWPRYTVPGPGKRFAIAAEITLAVRKPCAIRPPNAVVAANSSLVCTALLSPDTPANKTMSASVIVLEKLAVIPG